MLLINKTAKTLSALERKTMQESGYWERRDIQALICRSPDAFCTELGDYIHIVGSEVQPTEFVQDRIDLLGVDENGIAVIIELKRSNHELHLLQALSYAGMVAKWEPRRFIESLRDFNGRWSDEAEHGNQLIEDAKDELEEVLQENDIEVINRSQRIVLLAEEFDYEVLVTCEWLTEKYDLDIRCYRLALAKQGDDDFLTCTTVYPPPELTDIAVRRRRKFETGEPEPTEWSEEAKKIQNEAISDFFTWEIANGRRFNPRSRRLQYAIGDRQRFLVYAKRYFARVYQAGRFEKDIDFWSSRLGGDAAIAQISHGRALRFYLRTAADVEKFKHAASTDLLKVTFSKGPEVDDDILEGDDGND